MMLDLNKKEREEPEIRERRRIRRARQQGQEEQGEREESINMTSNRNDTMIEPETEFIWRIWRQIGKKKPLKWKNVR